MARNLHSQHGAAREARHQLQHQCQPVDLPSCKAPQHIARCIGPPTPENGKSSRLEIICIDLLQDEFLRNIVLLISGWCCSFLGGISHIWSLAGYLSDWGRGGIGGIIS